jgi:hypothetical protein
VAESLPEGDGLALAKLGQRDVLDALKAPHGVRHRLAVPREDEPAHRVSGAALCAERRRSMVSDLPSMAATWKMGGLAVLPVRAITGERPSRLTL